MHVYDEILYVEWKLKYIETNKKVYIESHIISSWGNQPEWHLLQGIINAQLMHRNNSPH